MSSRLTQSEVVIMSFGEAAFFRDTKPLRIFAVRIARQVRGSVPHPDGGHIVGFSNTCTHMGCSLVGKVARDRPLDYSSPATGEEHLVAGPCPCHGTRFDLLCGGLVIMGPATQNLPQLELSLTDGGDLVAEGWLVAEDHCWAYWPGEQENA